VTSQLHYVDCNIFMESMLPKSANLILADPPYEIDVDLTKFFELCAGHVIIFGKLNKDFYVFEKNKFGENIRVRSKPDKVYLWIKSASPKNVTKQISDSAEAIYIWVRGKTYNSRKKTRLGWENYSSPWYDLVDGPQVHPHQKPSPLIERLMLIYSNPGDIVFDPYAGSGTTLAAADKLGRTGIGCEINPV